MTMQTATGTSRDPIPITATCDMQLRVTPGYGDYAHATTLLWGPAGEYAATEFTRLNREHFAGAIPPKPIIIGLTAYGACIGSTLREVSWLESPRITLAPEIFTGNHRTPGGPRMVSDVLLHEMVHAALILRGLSPKHNDAPWCRLITELSPGVLGAKLMARPVRTRRVPNPARAADPSAPKTVVARLPEPGCLPQRSLARWPQSLRSATWYDSDRPIHVPTY
jgi:hypothetical protein